MFDWYQRYYAEAPASYAYGEFCRRVFGRNLAQHGFADMAQIDLLVEELALRPGERVLDLGCGTGGITDYVAASAGVLAVGMDYVEPAVCAARAAYGKRCEFVAADMGALCFCPGSFDALFSIDTLYFTPLEATVAAMTRLLRPGGRMGILYTHGADPEHPLATFDRATLPAERTPLGVGLAEQGLVYRTWDLTAADRQHALVKKRVLEELRPIFAAESNEFLFENRYGEANGVLAAIEAGAHARYLYLVTQPKG